MQPQRPENIADVVKAPLCVLKTISGRNGDGVGCADRRTSRTPHLRLSGRTSAQRGVEAFGRRRRQTVEEEKEISSSAGVGETH